MVALGLVREDRVVRSRVPEAAAREPYVLVLVGKPTDETGFGGASFASAILEQEAPGQRGHVQVPDPFLKRVLFEANRAALDWLFEAATRIVARRTPQLDLLPHPDVRATQRTH